MTASIILLTAGFGVSTLMLYARTIHATPLICLLAVGCMFSV